MLPQNQNTPVEYDVFGVPAKENTEDFWADLSNDVNGQEPAQQEQMVQEQKNNDEVRFQYFQSLYDKERNRTMELERQLAEYSAQAGLAQQQQNSNPEVEDFPAPPPAPRKPANLNSADLVDPNSATAQYYSEMMSWQEQIAQYNALKADYVKARADENYQSLYQQMNEQQEMQQKQSQRAQQIGQVITLVQQKYGVDYNTALDFVDKMTNPQPSVDELWDLYRIQSGKSIAPNYAPGVVQQPPTMAQQYPGIGVQQQPSPSFVQTQRAQSVPLPMGVQPARQPQLDPMAQFFDNMIASENAKNKY